MCIAATGQAGDTCRSEVDCAAGLACQLNGAEADNNRLVASCTLSNDTRTAGSLCDIDEDCRNGTCELGRCIDLCRETDDCIAETSCVTIPRTAVGGTLFAGCLLTRGTLTWTLPTTTPRSEVLLPIPVGATSAGLVMNVDDPGEKVGASRVLDASGNTLLEQCRPAPQATVCTPTELRDQYFANAVRHRPEFGQSVLLMPSIPRPGLQNGAYQIQVQSFWPSGALGSAVPRVTAVVKMSSGDTLDLHFHFLGLDNHPCSARTGGETLDRAHAEHAVFFQDTLLGGLRAVFNRIGLAVEAASYLDIHDRPDLDGIDIADVGSLLALGRQAGGINVFFVRSLSPIGIQAYSPSPGPAGIGGTAQSGIVVSLDTLCYRDWEHVSRLLAHQIARYMGLYHNIEVDAVGHATWRDPIEDSDDTGDNLMYFAEHAGTVISAGQREILIRSAVLR